ncbi:MAG: GTP-binding protein HflX [Sphingobacteriales bacterium]|jgi:GTP-binding protein HflX
MASFIDTAEGGERAILVGVITQKQTEEQVKEYLTELAFLANTAGAEVLDVVVQKLEYPNPKTFVGSGKLLEIKELMASLGVDLVIFDDELNSAQIRNLERDLDCKILDRSNLILDIFAGRAQTAHAKAQVELAQYQYLLPRLSKLWTHLQKQKGGIGMKGPGEKEIETDRRIIRDKISALKTRLKDIDRQMQTQRKNRGNMVRLALVGYTNVGKSTIMNLVAKSDVFAEDKLFATLDTTVRKVVFNNVPFLLSDTVGFIRKLPHQLVESFKSTLDEVRDADLLIHVVDISHKSFEDHFNVVNETLAELGVGDKPILVVFNKIDNYTYTKLDDEDLSERTQANWSLEELKNTWMSKMGNENCLFISALEKENIEEFREVVYEWVKKIHAVRYPYNDFLY